LGKGSTSLVYEGTRKNDNEKVAIKETKMFELPEEKRERCLKEVQLLQCLHHPNIISLEDSFLTENHLVLILEYAGGDLRQLIDKQRAAGFLLMERHVWGLFTQLTGALRYMHGKRIMHRDIKPSNVLVTVEGLKMGDLGLGRQFSSQTNEAFSKVGTPYYVSPEVVGSGGYDFKSDIWSLGCVLYELVTLRNPFEFTGATLASVFAKIIRAEYDPLDGEYSDGLKELVANMLTVDPARRPGINEVDDVACREYLRMCDSEECPSPGVKCTPLEALAQSIRPKYTGQKSLNQGLEGLVGGLPNMPVLPAINEMASFGKESMPIETEAVNENDLSNTAATLGSNQPQYPLIPYDEQAKVNKKAKKPKVPTKGTPKHPPDELVYLPDEPKPSERFPKDQDDDGFEEDVRTPVREIRDAKGSQCCIVA